MIVHTTCADVCMCVCGLPWYGWLIQINVEDVFLFDVAGFSDLDVASNAKPTLTCLCQRHIRISSPLLGLRMRRGRKSSLTRLRSETNFERIDVSILDCYWVGSLDLTFWLKSRGCPLSPPKNVVKLFAGGSLQQPRIVCFADSRSSNLLAFGTIG